MEFMLVTAILPTRGRPQMAWDALDCILKQRWRELEILVIDDEEDPSIAKPEESCFTYRTAKGWSLAKKLNRACSLAKGEYLLHFYDDDLSAPDRIADQVSRLKQSEKAVTSYRNLRFTDGKTVWINRNWPGGYGTSLCYRRDWALTHPFPLIDLSEDWPFVAEAMRADQFIAGDAGDKMLIRLTHNAQVGEGWDEIAAA